MRTHLLRLAARSVCQSLRGAEALAAVAAYSGSSWDLLCMTSKKATDTAAMALQLVQGLLLLLAIFDAAFCWRLISSVLALNSADTAAFKSSTSVCAEMLQQQSASMDRVASKKLIWW